MSFACQGTSKRVITHLVTAGLSVFALTNLAACGQSLETAPAASPFEIQLPSRSFTPKAGAPADLGARMKHVIAQTDPKAAPEKARAHILVQLQTPPEPADRDRLAKQGLILLEPFSRRVWSAAATSRGAEILARLKGVRWADLIEPQDKLAKAVHKDAPLLPYRLRPEGRIAYSVLFHKDVTADEVEALAKRLDLKLEDFDASSFPVVRAVTVTVPKGGLAALAEADIVAWIEPSPAPDDDGNFARSQPLANVDVVQIAPYNLSGNGVTVGIWEQGDVVLATHVDLTPRVTIAAAQVATTDDHANHVAGTIGASGVNFPNAEGMAPSVSIMSWDSAFDTNEMTAAADAAAVPRVQASNHSYYDSLAGWNVTGNAFQDSQSVFGTYDNATQAFDNVVVNTDLIVSKIAGNSRQHDWDGVAVVDLDGDGMPDPTPPNDCQQGGFAVDADCIDPRGTAKNVITVGAMNGAGAIWSGSGFGPTDDGRLKPDLMAEGNVVFSLGGSNNNDTSTKSGTSMTAPVVTGVAALVLEAAADMSLNVSAAAMKALLIQTAQDVSGPAHSAAGPDYATGWGIVDAEAAVNLLRQSVPAQGTLNATGIGNAWTSTFYVPVGQAEVHLTLAWVDPAGNPAAAQNLPKLINDLDLRLIAPDLTQFTPWTLNPAAPEQAAVRNGGNDAVNNVEQVSVLNPMAGGWTVQVSADAGNLPQAPQAFAVAGLLTRSDVVLVMDRSGSMALDSGTAGVNKLEALQSAANEFVDLLDLGGGHKLGLVQFEENLVPFVPPFDLQQLAAGNVGDAHTAIDSMDTGGWTNIIAGVDEAASQLGAIAPPFPRQTIVVFSDGKHNRPVGSDLNVINATVQAGNYTFYSIGFGTDVNDAILIDVANNSGGIHVNEQDLSPIQLTKYFLTVGALVHDMAVLSDPSYQLGAGETAKLPVNLSKSDQSVTFAVNWTGEHAKDISLALLAPDGRCRIPLIDHKGLRIRKGKTYRLIRVELPYTCNGLQMHGGTWTIHASPENIAADDKETVDIMILGDSRLKLEAKASLDRKERRLLLVARPLQDGRPLRKLRETRIVAHILFALPDSGDSEKQDSFKKGDRPKTQEPSAKERRMKTIPLYDDGKNGDRKAGDGIFTAALDFSYLKPGLLQARLVATLQEGKLKLMREASVSFYVK